MSEWVGNDARRVGGWRREVVVLGEWVEVVSVWGGGSGWWVKEMHRWWVSVV